MSNDRKKRDDIEGERYQSHCNIAAKNAAKSNGYRDMGWNGTKKNAKNVAKVAAVCKTSITLSLGLLLLKKNSQSVTPAAP